MIFILGQNQQIKNSGINLSAYSIMAELSDVADGERKYLIQRFGDVCNGRLTSIMRCAVEGESILIGFSFFLFV